MHACLAKEQADQDRACNILIRGGTAGVSSYLPMLYGPTYITLFCGKWSSLHIKLCEVCVSLSLVADTRAAGTIMDGKAQESFVDGAIVVFA